MPTELILIRHGESTGNRAALAASAAGQEVIDVPARDADVPLSDTGTAQAHRLGRVFAELARGDRSCAVWSSPYVRAVQTAQIGLDAAGVRAEVSVDERLRDRELGVLDTLTGRGVSVRFPHEDARRRWLGKFYYRPPGGESWADLALRVRAFLGDLDRVERADRVVVVCHDAIIMLIRYVCEVMTEAQVLEISAHSMVHNASVTRLVRDGGGRRWALHSFDDVRHLEHANQPVTEQPGDTGAKPH